MQAVVFLDRDGTINVDHGHVYRIDDWEFVPGAIEAIRRVRQAGYAVAVVSNQSGVGSGRYSVADVTRLHQHVAGIMSDVGAPIDAWAFCPHVAIENCECRKPKVALAHEIACQLGGAIDFPASWTIGDKPSDIEFGRNLGTRTVLIASRYWTTEDEICQSTHVASSLKRQCKSCLGLVRSHVHSVPTLSKSINDVLRLGLSGTRFSRIICQHTIATVRWFWIKNYHRSA